MNEGDLALAYHETMNDLLGQLEESQKITKSIEQKIVDTKKEYGVNCGHSNVELDITIVPSPQIVIWCKICDQLISNENQAKELLSKIKPLIIIDNFVPF